MAPAQWNMLLDRSDESPNKEPDLTVALLSPVDRWTLTVLAAAANTLFWVVPLFVVTVAKLLLPFPSRAPTAVADAGGHRGALDRGQQLALLAVEACAGAGDGHSGAEPAAVVSHPQQPCHRRGHPAAAIRVLSAHPLHSLLHQAEPDLGAGARPGLVGAGFPVHEASFRRLPRTPSRKAPAGFGDGAPGLCEVSHAADLDPQFRRGHALHARPNTPHRNRHMRTC